jgi:hypothetical protein
MSPFRMSPYSPLMESNDRAALESKSWQRSLPRNFAVVSNKTDYLLANKESKQGD